MSNDLYLSNDPLGLWQGDGLDELGDLCRWPCPESRRTTMAIQQLDNMKIEKAVKTDVELFYDALDEGRWPDAKAFIEDGRVNVNTPRPHESEFGGMSQVGTNPLFTGYLSVEALSYLVEQRGADVNACRKADGFTPLMAQTTSANWDGVAYLLKAGADVRSSRRGMGSVLSELFSETCNPPPPLALVKELIDAGADLHGCDSYGANPIFYAVVRNHMDAVNLMLERGADPCVRCADGTSAFSRLIELGQLGIIETLVGLGRGNAWSRYAWASLSMRTMDESGRLWSSLPSAFEMAIWAIEEQMRLTVDDPESSKQPEPYELLDLMLDVSGLPSAEGYILDRANCGPGFTLSGVTLLQAAILRGAVCTIEYLIKKIWRRAGCQHWNPGGFPIPNNLGRAVPYSSCVNNKDPERFNCVPLLHYAITTFPGLKLPDVVRALISAGVDVSERATFAAADFRKDVLSVLVREELSPLSLAVRALRMCEQFSFGDYSGSGLTWTQDRWRMFGDVIHQLLEAGATEAECSEEDAATLRRFLADEKKSAEPVA